MFRSSFVTPGLLYVITLTWLKQDFINNGKVTNERFNLKNTTSKQMVANHNCIMSRLLLFCTTGYRGHPNWGSWFECRAHRRQQRDALHCSRYSHLFGCWQLHRMLRKHRSGRVQCSVVSLVYSDIDLHLNHLRKALDKLQRVLCYLSLFYWLCW